MSHTRIDAVLYYRRLVGVSSQKDRGDGYEPSTVDFAVTEENNGWGVWTQVSTPPESEEVDTWKLLALRTRRNDAIEEATGNVADHVGSGEWKLTNQRYDGEV